MLLGLACSHLVGGTLTSNLLTWTPFPPRMRNGASHSLAMVWGASCPRQTNTEGVFQTALEPF